jgi:hypothetical protein
MTINAIRQITDGMRLQEKAPLSPIGLWTYSRYVAVVDIQLGSSPETTSINYFMSLKEDYYIRDGN